MVSIARGNKKFQSKKPNFTIDHILNVAGEKSKEKESVKLPEETVDEKERKFEWLNCTRYKPPKLPRQRKNEGIRRRKLGRNPRIPFSSSQVALLEAKFLQSPYLSSSDVIQLASYLKLTEARVKIWFQNRRAREKREKETRKNYLSLNEESQLPNGEIQENPEPTGTSNSAAITMQSIFPMNYVSLKCINYLIPENYTKLMKSFDLRDKVALP